MDPSDTQGKPVQPVLPSDLPPELALLIPDEELRGVVAVSYRLFSDEKFRQEFWIDPAAAMVRVGLSAHPRSIAALQRLDKSVYDRLVKDWSDVSMRAQAFKSSSSSGPVAIAFEALLMGAAFAVGMVGAHYLAHHVLAETTRDI